MSGVKVRTKPRPIHAIQWLGHNLKEVAEWMEDRLLLIEPPHTRMWPGDAQPTLVISNVRMVSVGSWLVIGETLEVLTDRAFREMYEVIE